MKRFLVAAALGGALWLGSAEAGAQTFANCSEAEAAGFTDIPRGAPGYRDALDRDRDGIACESGTDNGSGVVVSDDDLPMTGAYTDAAVVLGSALLIGGGSWVFAVRGRRRPA